MRSLSTQDLLAEPDRIAGRLEDAISLDPEAARWIATWLTDPRFDSERDGLLQVLDQALAGEAEAAAELAEAFAGHLPIGTGGRRGQVGPGPNRINSIVLRQTVVGLVSAMRDEGAPPRVVVLYDTRTDSRTFAQVVTAQLAGLGVEVLLVDAPRPTPMQSFMVRRHGCGAGVVISASHNPPGDNGIKVYGRDGAQVLGARDRALMAAIEAAADRELPALPVAPAEVASLPGVHVIDPETDPVYGDRPYLDYVAAQGVEGDVGATGLTVAFTPLHGVGASSVVPVLREKGVQVHLVERQCDPDGGRFSTVKSANPESPASMAMVVELARATGAQLALATDPDADRIGAFALDGAGEYQFIDGNRLGVLMADHVVGTLSHRDALPRGGRVVITTVTTPLVASIARARGLEVIDDLLVGFKHHAGVVEESPERPLIFACEESHGYVRGNEIRDKDGAIGAVMLAEAAAAALARGETLFDRLRTLWGEHGYHREQTRSIWARGTAGKRAIAEVMRRWRAEAPASFGGLEVRSVEDRLAPRNTGSPTRDLPGNVLSFELASPSFACRLVLRPSGTEPKLKVYALVRGEPVGPSGDLDAQIVAVDELVGRVLGDAEARAQAIMSPLLGGS